MHNFKPSTHRAGGSSGEGRGKKDWGFSCPFFFFLRESFLSIHCPALSVSGMESVTQLQGLLLIVGFYFYFLLPSRTPDEIILPELTQLEAAGIRGASEEVMQFHFH